MKSLKYYKNIALSNRDILKLLDNQSNIILYPDIHKFDNIDQLIQPYGSCIILYEAKPHYGHWCALLKTNNTDIEFFNPYGGIVDDSLDRIKDKYKIATNQAFPYLSYLMYKSNYNLFYNEFQFQNDGSDNRTCGRHCVVRVLRSNLDIYEYKKFLDSLCKLFNTDYDGVVTYLTI